MKEKNIFPPNFKEISEVFDIKGRALVFTYGDYIYNPYSFSLSEDLIVHETVHSEQQKRLCGPSEPASKGAELWWGLYIQDRKFRYEQELEAYRKQYAFVKSRVGDRNQVAKFLHEIACDFSSGIYGHIVTYPKAIKEISTP